MYNVYPTLYTVNIHTYIQAVAPQLYLYCNTRADTDRTSHLNGWGRTLRKMFHCLVII